jgi:hypothetical protein
VLDIGLQPVLLDLVLVELNLDGYGVQLWVDVGDGGLHMAPYA